MLCAVLYGSEIVSADIEISAVGIFYQTRINSHAVVCIIDIAVCHGYHAGSRGFAYQHAVGCKLIYTGGFSRGFIESRSAFSAIACRIEIICFAVYHFPSGISGKGRSVIIGTVVISVSGGVMIPHTGNEFAV